MCGPTLRRGTRHVHVQAGLQWQGEDAQNRTYFLNGMPFPGNGTLCAGMEGGSTRRSTFRDLPAPGSCILDQWTPVPLWPRRRAQAARVRVDLRHRYDMELRNSISTGRLRAWVNGSLARGYGHLWRQGEPIRSREGERGHKLDPRSTRDPLWGHLRRGETKGPECGRT